MKQLFSDEKHVFSQIINTAGRDYDLMVKLHIRYSKMDYRVSSTMLSSGGYDLPVRQALEQMNDTAHNLGVDKLLAYQKQYQPAKSPMLPFPEQEAPSATPN